jgi:hypothetical protein
MAQMAVAEATLNRVVALIRSGFQSGLKMDIMDPGGPAQLLSEGARCAKETVEARQPPSVGGLGVVQLLTDTAPQVLPGGRHWDEFMEGFVMSKSKSKSRSKSKSKSNSKVCEVRDVPDTDPRVGLRGQKTLYAAEAIRRSDVVMPYQGYLCFESEYERLSSPLTKLDYERYTCEVFTEVEPPAGHEGSLVLVGYGFGNHSLYINDPVIDPYSRAAAVTVAEPNVQLWEVTYRGWPYVFVGAIRDIAVGEELFMNYSRTYWDGIALQQQMHTSLQRALRPIVEEVDAYHSRCGSLCGRSDEVVSLATLRAMVAECVSHAEQQHTSEVAPKMYYAVMDSDSCCGEVEGNPVRTPEPGDVFLLVHFRGGGFGLLGFGVFSSIVGMCIQFSSVVEHRAEMHAPPDVFSLQRKNRCQVIREDMQDWARQMWRTVHKRARHS